MICKRFNVEQRRPSGKRPATNSRGRPVSALLPTSLDVAVSDTARETARRIEEEWVIEGLLHVTAVQAGSCMERFGDLTGASPSAPPLLSALQDSHSTADSRVVSEAICFATPPDAPEQPRRPIIVQQQAANTPDNRRSGALQAEATDSLVRAEVQQAQRTALLEIYSAEALQAAAAVRRQRRKALVRALRAGRDTTQALLAGPAAVLGSLTSRDESDY